MYKLDITKPTGPWANFWKSLTEDDIEGTLDLNDAELSNWANNKLKKYNASLVIPASFATFKTEADAIMFILKFS